MAEGHPVVSAVIPTRNRPELVVRAVRSVFAQTFQDIECVVVVDGPDPATVNLLEELSEPRLRIVALGDTVGACQARNIGAGHAKGEWVALLDDDDEWLSNRLDRQLTAVKDYEGVVTMVASQFLDRAGAIDVVRPRRFPQDGQPISDFLWCEVTSLGGIEGFPQTSTWLIRRDFFLAVPFKPGLKALQDLDWLIRAYSDPRMVALFLREPLTIFNNDHARDRVAKKIDWRFSYAWAMENRDLFTPKALSYFLVIYCVNPAAQQGGSWKQGFALLGECFKLGRVDTKLLVLFALYTSVYPTIGKVLSRRTRSVLLYRVSSAWKS